MLTVYISGPLHAVENLREMREFYEFLGETCAQCEECEYYLPHLHTDPDINGDLTSLDVFQKDREALHRANVIVAYIGRPSSGVGAELGLAISEGLHVIALYQESDQVSRFLLGMLADAENAQSFQFSNKSHCRELLRTALARVKSMQSY